LNNKQDAAKFFKAGKNNLKILQKNLVLSKKWFTFAVPFREDWERSLKILKDKYKQVPRN